MREPRRYIKRRMEREREGGIREGDLRVCRRAIAV